MHHIVKSAADKRRDRVHALSEHLGHGVRHNVAQHAAAWGQPDAVSIALPCVVCRGTVIACNGKYTDAVGFDWMRWSQKTFGAPVFLMNDAAAALLGEMRCGAAKDTDAAAILMIGTGIGSAAAQDRFLFFIMIPFRFRRFVPAAYQAPCCGADYPHGMQKGSGAVPDYKAMYFELFRAAAPAARRAVWKHGRELGRWMRLPVRRMGLRKVPWRMRER